MSSHYVSASAEGAWVKRAIFVSLYALLLESLIEWGIVIYLYVERHVDARMTPSLILALAAVSCEALSSISNAKTGN